MSHDHAEAMIRLVATVGCCLVLFGLTACDRGPDAPVLDLPPRPIDAPGGSEIVADIGDLDLDAREARIYHEVSRGNVPSWSRDLRRVRITAEVDERSHRLTFWAMPDYLAVGSDDDHFFVPLSPRTARRIADRIGGSVPTPAMVDAVWSAARVRLIPIRIPPDERIGTVRYFRRHDRLVQAQRRQHGAPPGTFVAGHKLDVVLVPSTTAAHETDVGVYGWHLPDGTPIQPLYRIAHDSPPHFSMGVRLVHRRILVDEVDLDLRDALRDPSLARLLGGEGEE